MAIRGHLLSLAPRPAGRRPPAVPSVTYRRTHASEPPERSDGRLGGTKHGLWSVTVGEPPENASLSK